MPTNGQILMRRNTPTAAFATPLAVAATLAASLLLPGAVGAAKSVRVRLDASSHAPRAGAQWTAAVTARRGTTAMSGTVSLDVLYGGQVVRHVSSGKLRGGAYSKTVRWPTRAVGYPLQFRATVRSGSITRRRFFAVRVHK